MNEGGTNEGRTNERPTNDGGATDGAHTAAAQALADATGIARHDVAVVLGSGWRPAADLIGEAAHEIPVADLPASSPPR
jgi:purine-nucleoside phosphorylase